jgi:DNA-binding PadR family transcriptional regulator
MPKPRDKRRRSDLDLFILALIDGGVSTPYELQSAAGLSQGATSPALQRLLEARFVLQGKQGARGRIDYKVSAAGKRVLKDGWRTLIEAGPTGDLDSDLRVALLTLWGGGDRDLAAEFLRGSAEKKSTAIDVLNARSITEVPLASWYTHLRSATSEILITAESNAIRALAEILPGRLTDRPKRSPRPTEVQKGA